MGIELIPLKFTGQNVSNLERRYCTKQDHLKRKTFSTLTVINATLIMEDKCGAGTVSMRAICRMLSIIPYLDAGNFKLQMYFL